MTFLRIRVHSQRWTSIIHARRYSAQSITRPCGFQLWSDYFSEAEQRTLLAASLYKLDSTEPRQSRRRRKEYWKSSPEDNTGTLTDLFAPDAMYDFHKARF